MEILNKKYYNELLSRVKNIQTLPHTFNENVGILSYKLIINQWQNNNPIHVNFQTNRNTLIEIYQQLYVELANDIFCNSVDLPPLNIGDKLRSKKKYGVGKAKPICLDFSIRGFFNGRYHLLNEQHQVSIEKKYDDLVTQFIPLIKRAHEDTLTHYISFFEKLNGKSLHEFVPTNFEKKFVFIAPKNVWDSLKHKNKIPSTYMPSPREEGNIHEIKSIPSLPDSIMYFTTRYEVCYRELLTNGERIETIVVCDTEEERIEQMLQDRAKFGFNILLLTNSFQPKRHGQIPCWDWFKEEIEIVNSL